MLSVDGNTEIFFFFGGGEGVGGGGNIAQSDCKK